MKMILGALLAGGAVYVAFVAGTGRALPFGMTAGAAVWWVLGLGMAACGVAGIGDVVARVGNDWLSPWVLVGIVLGVALLGSAFAALKGLAIGPVAGSSQWMLVIATLIVVKVLVASAQALTTMAGRA